MKEERVSYSLGTINAPAITGGRGLSKEEFERLENNIQKLTKESMNESLYNIVELNYDELKHKKDQYIAHYPSNLMDMYDFKAMFIDLNRLVLNLLSSIRTYLDHTETRLKREYGEKSVEFIEFKKSTNDAFDSDFSYSFLEKLRNYAQHCGLPAGSVTVNSEGDEQDQTVNTLTLSLDRDDLLAKFDWTPKKVKEELLLQEPTFDLFPLIDKKIETLQKINSKISGKYYAALEDEAYELLDLIIEAIEIGGIPVLLKISGTLENPTVSPVEFPYKEIAKITNSKINFIYPRDL